jgi:hypothetical protein
MRPLCDVQTLAEGQKSAGCCRAKLFKTSRHVQHDHLRVRNTEWNAMCTEGSDGGEGEGGRQCVHRRVLKTCCCSHGPSQTQNAVRWLRAELLRISRYVHHDHLCFRNTKWNATCREGSGGGRGRGRPAVCAQTSAEDVLLQSWTVSDSKRRSLVAR